MFPWFRKDDRPVDSSRTHELAQVIRQAYGDDEQGARIVVAIAGLLVCVAYADSEYSEPEQRLLRTTLSRINGLDSFAVETITKIIDQHKVDIAGAEATSYARELLDLTEEDFRLQLLDMLLDMAAADGEIDLNETNMLRAVVPALGLTQKQYNASQARYRERLSVLK